MARLSNAASIAAVTSLSGVAIGILMFALIQIVAQ